MYRFSMRKIWLVAKTEYIKWVTNPRMLLLLILLVFCKNCALDPLVKRSVEMGTPLNVLEPFIAMGNSGVLLLILPLVFLTLMSDFPKMDGNTIFFLPRTGRVNWLLGQVFFSIMSSATYVLVVLLGSVLMICKDGFLCNGWSLVVSDYAKTHSNASGTFADSLIPTNLFCQMPPYEALIKTALFLMAYLLMLALVMLLFNIWKRKILGFFVTGCIITAGVATCAIKTAAMWIFPMAHAVTWLHYTSVFREMVVSMRASYLYFGIGITVLFAANLFMVRRFSVDTIQEVDG